MITQAYIMGALGKAAFQQDGKWYVLHADEPTLARRWHPLDNNLLSLNNPEVVQVPAPKSIEQLSQLLRAEATKQEALTLALQLMDGNIERYDLKERIAALLAEYAQEETVARFLENRLLSTPVPASFQPGLASNLCRAVQQQRMAALYDLLDRHADDMETIRVAWIKIAKKNFESGQQAYAAYALLVEEGHLTALTRALAARSTKDWDKAALNAAFGFKKAGIASDARLLSALKAELAGYFEAKAATYSLDVAPAATDEIERIIEDYLDEQAQRGRKTARKDKAKAARQPGRRQRASDRVEFANVEGIQKNLGFNTQKITQALAADNPALAWHLVQRLIESQIGKSEPKHICKSLSGIAAAVTELGKYDFARQLLHYALMLNDNDAVVFNQKAEILKSEGKLSEAKAEYLQIKTRFPDNVVAQNGYAEILKSEGKLSDARVEWAQIKTRFPHDIWAYNGYAEILKLEGNLLEAKSEYAKVKARFPHDVWSKTGYAEVLKLEGKLSEAKAEYIQIKTFFPDNVVVQTGYAEILKSEGKLSEAKAEYLQIKTRFPDNVVAQNGYAEILKLEGNLLEAKSEYAKVKARFPHDVWSKTGYAEVLKLEGKLSEAKAEYIQIKTFFPDNVVVQNGYAEILKSEGKLSEAKAEYLQIKTRFPQDVVTQNGYAEILKSEGKLSEAKAEYEAILKKSPYNDIARHAYFSLLLSLGQSTEQAPPPPVQPQTEMDFYWLHFHIKRLLWEANWEEAQRLNDLALRVCPFMGFKKTFRRTRQYIHLQAKEFESAMLDLDNEVADDHPVGRLLATHALAALGEQDRAYTELAFCKQFRDNKVVYEPLCLISERYSINGLPKIGASHEVLDREILRTELLAVTLED